MYLSQEIHVMNTSDGWNQNCTVCTRSVISRNATVYFISFKMLTHILINNHMFNLLVLCSSSWCFPVLISRFLWFCSNLNSMKPRDSDTARQIVPCFSPVFMLMYWCPCNLLNQIRCWKVKTYFCCTPEHSECYSPLRFHKGILQNESWGAAKLMAPPSQNNPFWH